MKRSLYFAWLTAVVGVVCANRRPKKEVVAPAHHCGWFVRSGGHQVIDDTISRIAVQPERRLGRILVRRRDLRKSIAAPSSNSNARVMRTPKDQRDIPRGETAAIQEAR